MSSNNNSTILYGGQTIRTKTINGTPWFVAKDVCDILGIKNSRDAVDDLDPHDVSDVAISDVRSENGVIQKREMKIVNESGLYTLIFKSRKEEAKKFQRWVTGEVLPMIRKYGFYSTNPKKIWLAEMRLEKQAVKSMLDEMKLHISDTDCRMVAKDCRAKPWEVDEVLDGSRRDVPMLTLLYGRAVGNRELEKMFYTKEGAEKLLKHLQSIDRKEEVED